MDARIDQTVKFVDVHNVSNNDSSGVDFGSAPRQVGDREFEQPPFLLNSFVEGVGQQLDYEPGFLVPENLEYRPTTVFHVADTNIEDFQKVQEQAAYTEVESPEEQEVNKELISNSAKPWSKEEKSAKGTYSKSGSLMMDHHVSYQLPPDHEGKFAVYDLVWGKVKSHPWWPGQIFYPSDSSEKAMKYFKKDCYLVAYFGDRTFAWNEASVLKPFRNHFSQAERQNNSEAFRNAVSCALAEVARRVELGLACSCVSEEAYGKIKYQMVENSGIKEESSKREGADRSTDADSFQPDKFTEYVRSLALFPISGAERLELVIAKTQLLAFNRLRGYVALPDFQYYEGLVESDAGTCPGNQGMSIENEHVDSKTRVNSKTGPRKRKHNLKAVVYQRRKEKGTELVGETMYDLDDEFDSPEEDDIVLVSPTAGAGKKSPGFFEDDFAAPQKSKTVSVAKVSHTASPNPQQSFKVGDCIRRVASQLTGSSRTIKGCSEKSNDKHSGDVADEVLEPLNDTLTESTVKQSSLVEFLAQLHLSARDPMKGYSFFNDIISFFSEFRKVAVTTQRKRLRKGSSRKKKPSIPVVGSPETFEFDDRNDSYWTDMVVQDSAEAKPARRSRKRKDKQVVSGDHEKPLQQNPRKLSRKQLHHSNHVSTPVVSTEDEKQLDLPTELRLNFGEMDSVPSEVNLNKMFRRFGPLKESETEIDVQSSRARVVFKKRSDAEVAYSSAATYNIFGSTPVNYQLNYTPFASFSTPLALTNGIENTT
ncbi:uncharacterized protein LOC110719379 [Chenopodium quinoa]|uniref:uncharacterized protein LOC110719379 n=1 Tax=Chenopodium quinoa TaxID=63459 RepID=UPI000B78636D|nr:uncharacterized protein LOC110719379 [Chenopodium quinoa]XP_021753995.1 uncharacterized protein LOC110719379 [Chenopodium quinoa]